MAAATTASSSSATDVAPTPASPRSWSLPAPAPVPAPASAPQQAPASALAPDHPFTPSLLDVPASSASHGNAQSPPPPRPPSLPSTPPPLLQVPQTPQGPIRTNATTPPHRAPSPRAQAGAARAFRVPRPRALTLATATAQPPFALSASLLPSPLPASPRTTTPPATSTASLHEMLGLGSLGGLTSLAPPPLSSRLRTVSLTVRTDLSPLGPPPSLPPLSSTSSTGLLAAPNGNAATTPRSPFGPVSSGTHPAHVPFSPLYSPTYVSAHPHTSSLQHAPLHHASNAPLAGYDPSMSMSAPSLTHLLDTGGLMSPRAVGGPTGYHALDDSAARARVMSLSRAQMHTSMSALPLTPTHANGSSTNLSLSLDDLDPATLSVLHMTAASVSTPGASQSTLADYFAAAAAVDDSARAPRVRRATEPEATVATGPTTVSPAADRAATTSPAPDDDVLRTFNFLGLDDAESDSDGDPRGGSASPDSQQGHLSRATSSRRPPHLQLTPPPPRQRLPSGPQSATLPRSSLSFGPLSAGAAPGSRAPGPTDRVRSISLLSNWYSDWDPMPVAPPRSPGTPLGADVLTGRASPRSAGFPPSSRTYADHLATTPSPSLPFSPPAFTGTSPGHQFDSYMTRPSASTASTATRPMPTPVSVTSTSTALSTTPPGLSPTAAYATPAPSHHHYHPQVPTRSLWIGNLDAAHVTSAELMALFAPFGDIESLRVLADKECAFINYYRIDDARRAREAMAGAIVGGQPIKIGYGKVAKAEQYGAAAANGPMSPNVPKPASMAALAPMPANMADNTTPSRALWVGNLPAHFTVQQLSALFAGFGPIESCRILTHKNCGFVNFVHEADAVRARRVMHGRDVGGLLVRIGFARVPTSPPKQPSGVDVNTTLLTNINGTLVPGVMPYFPTAAPSSDAEMHQQQHQHHAHQFQYDHRSGMRHDSSVAFMNGQYHLHDQPQHHQQQHLMGAPANEAEPLSPLLVPIDAPAVPTELNGDHEYLATIPDLSEDVRGGAGPDTDARRLDLARVRDLRRRLDAAAVLDGSATETVADVYAACAADLIPLALDYTGNTFVQKLIERAPDTLRSELVHRLASDLAAIGVHKHGTWVVQKLIEAVHAHHVACPTDRAAQAAVTTLASALRPYAAALLLDPFGNYVVQSCLKLGVNDDGVTGAAAFVFDAMTTCAATIARGRFGARAMRACLESPAAPARARKRVAQALLPHAADLAMDPNGSLLVQWLVEASGLPGRHTAVALVLAPHVAQLAVHKVASTLLYKLVAQDVDPAARDAVLQAVLGDAPLDGGENGDAASVLDVIVADATVGAHLVQRLLACCVAHPDDRAKYMDRVAAAMVRRHYAMAAMYGVPAMAYHHHAYAAPYYAPPHESMYGAPPTAPGYVPPPPFPPQQQIPSQTQPMAYSGYAADPYAGGYHHAFPPLPGTPTRTAHAGFAE
ncbi:hypothetical protein AMAG_01098 [Allomyces macrogynus ATCC 38327]|uniref:PUM-HD domain-containing protein n=1 Tax=Allomyces macrogynus (strain ATCC 38327) TaxID=578462 RepID=A0A0L0RYM0_ALLM3|nr:hypothetical protein AMAG_01098 [Allomyces macrogynus ATCC 38327]|eukprot:KNE55179.1 hypothetical protein AMAG_01098 [Allomyces macrogynus ATCC 38327]